MRFQSDDRLQQNHNEDLSGDVTRKEAVWMIRPELQNWTGKQGRQEQKWVN